MTTVSGVKVHPFKAAAEAGRPAFKVKDLGEAAFGRREMVLAEHEMPGLMVLRERYAGKQPLAGVKVMGSLHMTIQTAVLIETLADLQHLLDPGPCRGGGGCGAAGDRRYTGRSPGCAGVRLER